MVDLVSIVIAVISFVGTLLTAGVTASFAYFSDERKRLTLAEKLVAKFRDPLLLACQDLQSRLYNITDYKITEFLHEPGQKKDSLLLYTAFVVGQYLSWTYILRREAQFLNFSTDRANRELTKALANINYAFGTDSYPDDGTPFTLWRGEQMAVGEVMTVKVGRELFSMGYATFRRKWMEDGRARAMPELIEPFGTSQACVFGGDREDGEDTHEGNSVEVGQVDEVKEGVEDGAYILSGEFRSWFRPIVEGVIKIAKARDEGQPTIPDQRLRRLQHLLLDLISILDEKGVRSDARWASPCHRAKICNCSRCDGNTACPCKRCKAPRGPGHV
jgi:hypothetical protein